MTATRPASARSGRRESGFAKLAALALALLAMCVSVTPGEGLLEQVMDAVSETVAGALGRTAYAPTETAQVEHAAHVEVFDHSAPQGSLPKVRLQSRVIDLVNAIHFDDLMQDTPDEMRPPSVVVFYDSNDDSCMAKYSELNWDQLAERELPARERLMTARYDMHAAPRRAWYKFTPEMDLAKRFGVTQCPEVVFAPRTCNGLTEWCVRDTDAEGIQYMGCEGFVESCNGTQKWDAQAEENLQAWISQLVDAQGEPAISGFLETLEDQGKWIKGRDSTTTDNHMRNIYLSQAFPAFTPRGFKAMPIPDGFRKWLDSFFTRNEKHRRTEYWDAESTQMGFHETPTSFLDMDRESHEKNRMANKYLKPLVEEWAHLPPGSLELTSFYGMREYPDGSILKNHVDRIDTHVLSVTISVKKLDEEKSKAHPWPLEVVDWNGDHVRYEHPGGTMVLYESSKLLHGRPFKNEGGTHVGCFAHFKPKSMHTEEAGKWDDIVATARAHQRRNSQYAGYRSTPSEEPQAPHFSSVEYGKGTRWRHKKDAESNLRNDQIPVTFKNKHSKTLAVYWQGHDDTPVHQGTVAPGASFDIGSYRGHKFFWSSTLPGKGKETPRPLPGGTMTVEKGRKTYVYSTN
ncbi:Hypothetical Protein FCC1311_021912 [Hondaea fermentalgiana]|uniref:Prolyl 4-hydroxylase alpha subunit domain-containing protein n=1 Tax=Hondaea fermentalgiana TaxID=2315210 RepID=A0A2R5GCS6_9STRA|nr:Hypothetical Protein FCC1311_021912 [Hondaea fermentalgiana]|eukprot:GBG25971.1 Hypothetical Protein FCC1311_021912 [Hondaea fermentalgiana]